MVRCLMVLAVVLGVVGRVDATDGVGSAVEEHGRRLVEAINSDDGDSRARTVRDVFTPASLADGGEARILAQLGRLRADLGTLEFHHAESVSHGEGASTRISLHVYARSGKDGGWRDLQFWLDPVPPHRIRNLVFLANVAEPVYLPNGDVTGADTLEWLGQYIDKLVADDDLSGGLLLARGDSVLLERVFGFADPERRRPITATTRFNMASGGKMFTAVAIADLVEEGRLHFTDAVEAVLPAVAGEPFVHGVTVAHLLSHTSGIAEFWNDDYEAHWNELKSLSQFLPFVRAAGTRFAPGERFEYSNSNYILLGLVLEAVTGKTYDDVLTERIFLPAGMRDTGLFPFDDADPAQAMRLARDGSGWKSAPHGFRGSSAGGGLTTSGDMLRFARALVGGKLVSTTMLTAMTTSKTTGLPDSPMAYGYGFELDTGAEGAPSFGHGGIAAGVNFELRCFPRADLTLVVFSNQDNGAYDDLRRNTTKLITGER